MYTGKRSSDNDERETPPDLFKKLDSEFNFTLDVCANDNNHKHHKYLTKEMNALSLPWAPHTCWMNPPYSQKKDWIKKAYDESQNGATVVCLVPSNTDTRWFHDYALKGEIRWLKGKLKFVGEKDTAPFPSMLIIFRPKGV